MHQGDLNSLYHFSNRSLNKEASNIVDTVVHTAVHFQLDLVLDLLKDIICRNSELKYIKTTQPLLYFGGLCNHIIPYVPNNVQTQRNPQFTQGNFANMMQINL